jgi:hypothetical protein
MPKSRTLKIVAGIAISFAGFAGTIILLSRMGIVTFEVAKLMLIALFAMYVGFGFLIVVYRFIGKLE